jgi:hypothetical protein
MRHTSSHPHECPYHSDHRDSSLLQAIHSRGTLPRVSQPNLQLQRPPPFLALTVPQRLQPTTSVLQPQNIRINSPPTAHSPSMLARLVLTRQEPRLFAQAEETLRKTCFLLNMVLASFKQHVVAICELRCPAVLLPLDAYLETRDVESVRGCVGCHGLWCWWRR